MSQNDPSTDPATALALFEYDDLVALYEATDAGQAAAEADRTHLRALAVADWEAGQWRSTREFVEPTLVIRSVALRTTPRYAGETLS